MFLPRLPSTQDTYAKAKDSEPEGQRRQGMTAVGIDTPLTQTRDPQGPPVFRKQPTLTRHEASGIETPEAWLKVPAQHLAGAEGGAGGGETLALLVVRQDSWRENLLDPFANGLSQYQAIHGAREKVPPEIRLADHSTVAAGYAVGFVLNVQFQFHHGPRLDPLAGALGNLAAFELGQLKVGNPVHGGYLSQVGFVQILIKYGITKK
jgi:hypothetical protein